MKLNPIRVIIVDDDPAHIEAIKRVLEASGNQITIDIAVSIADYHRKISIKTPNIALLDLNLPDGRAIDQLTYPAEYGNFPILVMTSFGNEQTAVDAIKSGAIDYLVKSPETFASIPRAIKRALREWQLLKERQTIQEKLQHSEQLLQRTGAMARIGGWELVIAEMRLIWSKEIYRIHELDYDQPISLKQSLNFYNPQMRGVITKAFQTAIEQGQSWNLELPLITVHSRQLWVRTQGEVELLNNKPIRLHGTVQDITERKQAEHKLREQTTLLENVINSSSDYIFVKDRELRTILCNTTFARAIGKTPAELYGKTDIENGWDADLVLGHPEKGIRGFQQDDLLALSGKEVHSESDLGNVYGEIRHFDSVKVPLHSADGEVLGILGISRDITERKRIDERLRIAATAFEAQQAMFITDVDTSILQINKAFTVATGYTAEETIGQKMSVFKSDQHDDAFYTAILESVNLTGSWQGEIWNRHKNGEIKPNWQTITAVKNADGVITHYIGTQIDISERKLAEEEIKKLAFYDPLTQLANRRLLQERLQHGIAMAKRDGKQLALLMLDLDRFKIVNDRLGHLAGDELLKQAADRITTKLRDVDLVARLGGDEFVVLLENLSHVDDAARIAEEIIIELSKPFKLAQSDDVQIGASIGISLYPQHGNSPDILLDHADAALYQAKDQGRGCCAYFSADITRSVRERIVMEIKLRNAIKQNELCVFYQPQIDIVSGCIIGAEALVRWQDPIEGLISPSHFIPIAEETHLIIDIGEWVLRKACNQGRQWLDRGLPSMNLSVNISPYQFRRCDISDLVAKVLAETGFPARHLELEITESGLMENQDKATAILDNLRSQGVRLAIDDFGTGYSSLAYLKRFPLDVLKIDKSFIDEIPHNKDDMEIAATIVAMGHTLSLKVMAEGVETLEQLVFLKKNGCDAYQGFIKSPPLPAEEFAEFVRNQQRSD